jgi:hypothetical protein
MPADSEKSSFEDTIAHPGQRESFQSVEAHAREVLRERGLSEDEIDVELGRAHRDDLID